MRAWKAFARRARRWPRVGFREFYGGESFAERVELARGFGDAAPTQESCLGERLEPLVQDGQGGGGRGAEAGPNSRVGALNADREQGRMIERKASEHQSSGDKVSPRVLRQGEVVEPLVEKFEGARPRPPSRPSLEPNRL